MSPDHTSPPAVWDRHSIKAEVHRRGMSLSGIARDAGLAESACRLALMGLNRKGADAIATALDIPFDVLFPLGMFSRSRSSHVKPTPSRPSESRQKSTRPVDEKRRRA